MIRATWAIIPVKQLSQAKRRLAPALPAEARRQLVLVMLRDVLGVLARVEEIATVLVVTPDGQVADVARAAGAAVLPEPRAAGLNAAVKAGLAYVREHGATEALVLPADVPLATADELRRIVRGNGASEPPRAVLVPSHDGEGTNALLMSPPGILQASFGAGSFLRHLGQAVARKVDVQVLQPSGLARDIDLPHDLAGLMAEKRGAADYAFVGAFLGACPGEPERRPHLPMQRTEP
jgi:2-phospho-L-lactate/phosphoenolpyruvate guanylyltransferase